MPAERERAAHRVPLSRDATTAANPNLPGKLSTLGLQLHLCAALVPGLTDRPAFVSDAFLATIAQDITLAIVELDMTGRWRRVEDGYEIPPRQLRLVIDMLHEM